MQPPNRHAAHTVPSVRILSTDQMREIAAELERIAEPGISPVERTQVLTWAMTFAGAYFRTKSGALRRVFPKGVAAEHFRQYQKEKANAAA